MKKILFGVGLICLTSLTNFAFADELNATDSSGSLTESRNYNEALSLEPRAKVCVCECFDGNVSPAEQLKKVSTKDVFFIIDGITNADECEDENDLICLGKNASGKLTKGNLQDCEIVEM